MKKVPLSIYSLIILLLVIVTGCDIVSKDIQQSDIELLAQNLELSYKFLEVKDKTDCLGNKSLEQCYIFKLSLTMPIDFDKSGWEIYFSQKNLIIKAESRDFTIEKMNGELHRLYAKENFKGFEQGKTIQILLTSKAVHLKDALLRPNFYVMSEGLKATAIKSSLSKQIK